MAFYGTIRKFLEGYRIKNFSKGELILYQGEVPETVLFIKSGIVKTYNITADGEEKPLSFDIQGEIFPVGWAFSRLHYAQYYYEAFTDCELYCIPREEYIAFIKNDTEHLYEMFEEFVGRYLNYQMRVNALEQSKASAKVLHTMHFLSLKFGKDIKDNVVRVQLPLTQQDLANFMGLTRETTSIELKKLQSSGIISYRNQKYTVRTDKLDALLDEDYDQGLVQHKRPNIEHLG